MSFKLAALLAVGILIPQVLGGQSKPADAWILTFDVVSVKPNKSADTRARVGWQPGGRWMMVNVSTAGLIRSAYPTKVDELIGAPAWVTSDRYDVDARATFEPTSEQKPLLLRGLLRDRFKLAAHYESRDRPVYNLVVARADGRLGRQIRRIDIDCATHKGAAPGVPAPPIADAPPCGYRMSGGRTMSMVSGGQTMQSLADAISGLAGRPILDKTGLSGYYAFTLESFDVDGVSIFTALQEQLGLKLEPARSPLDILVIDHIERPTEN